LPSANLYSLIDEVLKLMERTFYMQKTADVKELLQNGETVRPKKE
jgi:hypothetical protein